MELSNLASQDDPALRRLIVERLRGEGSISFADFMRLVLYDPAHGYYSTQDPTRDYQSSPNVHPIFGALIARQLADFWRLLDRPARFDVLEAGAGNGRLASDIARAVRTAEPDLYEALTYALQDVTYASPGTEARLEAAGLPLDKVAFASELPPPGTVEGCILSNELLDALPFDRVRRRDGRLYELRVGLEGDRLVDVEAPVTPAIERYFAAGVLPGEGCDAEANPAAVDWTARAAASLRRGYLLTLDYGYEAPELYAPWRRRGTLLTFYRHTSDDDPYARLGRQDITASIDLTAVRRAGEAAGLTTLGCTTQTSFLANLGAGEALSRPPSAAELESFYALRRAVLELTDGAGLGRIAVLVQGRSVPDTLPVGLTPPL